MRAIVVSCFGQRKARSEGKGGRESMQFGDKLSVTKVTEQHSDTRSDRIVWKVVHTDKRRTAK